MRKFYSQWNYSMQEACSISKDGGSEKWQLGSDAGSGQTRTAARASLTGDNVFPLWFLSPNIMWSGSKNTLEYFSVESTRVGLQGCGERTLRLSVTETAIVASYFHTVIAPIVQLHSLFVKHPGSLGIFWGHTFSYWKIWYQIAFRNLDFPVSLVEFEPECGLDCTGCLVIKNG